MPPVEAPVLLFVARDLQVDLPINVRRSAVIQPRTIYLYGPFFVDVSAYHNVAVGQVGRHAIRLNHTLGHGASATVPVVIAQDQAAGFADPPDDAKADESGVVAHDQVVRPGLLHSFDESRRWVRFVVLENAGFVIPGAGEHPMLCVGLKKIDCGLNDRVDVATLSMLWATLACVCPSVPLALHQAHQVSEIANDCVSTDGLIQMLLLKIPIALCVVVVPV